MATKKEIKEQKREAVAKWFEDNHTALNVLSGMWDEKTLDALILALGIGHVELDQ